MNRSAYEERKEGKDLIDAYDGVKQINGKPCLVVFTMQGCESCALFEEDLFNIAQIDAFHTVLPVSVTTEDEAGHRLAGHFGVKEFPTAFVLQDGQPVGGWAGYDKAVAVQERRAGLAAMVDRALERATNASGGSTR